LENINEIAKALKEVRIVSGKNQADFAKMLGVPQTTWSGYERGDFRPKLALLIALEAMGYAVPGLTSPVRDMIENEEISEEEAREKISYAQNLPDMDIDDISEAVSEHWWQVKKVAGGGGGVQCRSTRGMTSPMGAVLKSHCFIRNCRLGRECICRKRMRRMLLSRFRRI
jgi:transcriptional regulator with XRE-family HTH domain